MTGVQTCALPISSGPAAAAPAAGKLAVTGPNYGQIPGNPGNNPLAYSALDGRLSALESGQRSLIEAIERAGQGTPVVAGASTGGNATASAWGLPASRSAVGGGTIDVGGWRNASGVVPDSALHGSSADGSASTGRPTVPAGGSIWDSYTGRGSGWSYNSGGSEGQGEG